VSEVSASVRDMEKVLLVCFDAETVEIYRQLLR
jgi:hypothetical protein